jgi:hypothetical protein
MGPKLKSFLIIFIVTVAIIELIELGFKLMNTSDDYTFFIGLFIIGVLGFAGGYQIGKELYKIVKTIKEEKIKNK